MAFPSITFIFFFLPLTLLCYRLVPMKWKNKTLFAASLVFFCWRDFSSLLLLLFSLALNYYVGTWIERQESLPARRLILAGGLASNLFIWSGYRLLPILYEAFPHLFIEAPSLLPLGLCFYTLQGIGYLVDIYRREARAQSSLSAYGVYAAMFPRVPCGPLVRYTDFRRELAHRSLSRDKLAEGIWRFSTGLSKKVLLADNIAGLWQQVQATPAPGAAAAWLGAIAFAFWLYFDLSGCCDMAVGLGRMLGFTLPENFNLPYTAVSLWDFFKRWFSTLTSWLRDYLYRPLKGKGGRIRKVFAILVVGVLAGTWYGIGWQFVVWGLYCALLLAGERYLWGKALAKAPKLARQALTFLLVLIGWVSFSAESIPAALAYLAAMFGAKGAGLKQAGYLFSSYWMILVFCVLGAGGWLRRWLGQLGAHLPQQRPSKDSEARPLWKEILAPLAVLVLMVLCTAYLVGGSALPSWFMRF